MNYGLFLEENQYFEEAFKAYEKGISLFRWPHVYDLWNTYLSKFLDRYGGEKIERARDLFEQCLDTVPPQFAKNFYLLYAKLEEKHGGARRAMNIYEKATKAVDKKDQYQMFNIYIQKAASLYGVTKTRPIFESAMETLNDSDARQMGMRFSELETKLGEIDRARAIYAHTSQICDPRVSGDFWGAWKDFEVRHGNEDTIREMLRIKRSIQAMYNTQFTAHLISQQQQQHEATSAADATQAQQNPMAALNTLVQEQLQAPAKRPGEVSFVRGDTLNQPAATLETRNNPDEIELDEDDDDEEGGNKGEEMEVETHIPSEVFGSLKKTATASGSADADDVD
jgi:pre-mRNA-splicing factor SYF1